MRISFIIRTMSYSGAEKVLSIISDELANMGHQVSVLLLGESNGVKNTIGNINTYGVKSTCGGLKGTFERWKNIKNAAKQISPDVVISFGFVCNINMISALIGTSIPQIACERNDPVYDPPKKSKQLQRTLLYPFASGYVFQTERIRDYFAKSIGKRAAVIANPIIDSGIRWNTEKTNKSIVTVARLDDFQKDHLIMFDAFKIFCEKNPDYTLDVYGDGPDKELYQRVISDMGMQDKIILHGKSSSPLESIRSSEIFLLTSKFEGMPNALMEALSIGMPCVSTDCGGGGAAELFSMTNSGVIVPVGDRKSIADALDALVHDEKKKREFSANALKINEMCSKESIVKKWEDYILNFQKK